MNEEHVLLSLIVALLVAISVLFFHHATDLSPYEFGYYDWTK